MGPAAAGFTADGADGAVEIGEKHPTREGTFEMGRKFPGSSPSYSTVYSIEQLAPLTTFAYVIAFDLPTLCVGDFA